jgi:hypothetical protein
MRLFVILLLVALTAVRSWAGDVMAINMATQSHPTVAAHATAHDDCPGLHTQHAAANGDAAAVTPNTNSTDTAAADHCAQCASCQACFTVALVTPVLMASAQPPRHATPHTFVTAFTSAVPALGQKPPIS